GLVPTTLAGDCQGKCKVALLVAPGLDWHWLRKENDDRWSQKQGWDDVSFARDAQGTFVTNPEAQLALGPIGFYPVFGGYFCVPDAANVRLLAPRDDRVLASSATLAIEPEASVVTALWYSGQPNPSLALSAEDSAQVRLLLQNLALVPDPQWDHASRVP